MIKKTLLATAVSLSLLGSTLVSIDGFAKGGRGGGQGQRTTLLERLDSNGDGVLTQDEFIVLNAEKAERHFNYKDIDNDGVLSLEEFSTGNVRSHHLNDLEGLDTDALIQCMEEAVGYELPEHPDSETAFAAADTNADGSVDLDEFLVAGDVRAEERFDEIDGDGDGDGELTSDEIVAFRLVMQERRDARRICIAEQVDLEGILN